MKPAKPWGGLDEANGGYIIVKADGEIWHIIFTIDISLSSIC